MVLRQSFFKVFWKQRHFLVSSLNNGCETGELSATRKEGLIVCIPKSHKRREYIINWRTYFVIKCFFYKIDSSCVGNRLKNVLPSFISADQTGFMANRYMRDNTRLVYDLIHLQTIMIHMDCLFASTLRRRLTQLIGIL